MSDETEHEEPLEAKPVESGTPSDLMLAVEAAAKVAATAAGVGRETQASIAGLETSVNQATRRRTVLIAVGALLGVAVLVFTIVVLLLLGRIADVQKSIVECTTNPPPGETYECRTAQGNDQRRIVEKLRQDDYEDKVRVAVAVARCERDVPVNARAECIAKQLPVPP